MDYIDWIISTVVFVAIVALVLISISNLLPKTDNSNDIVSEGIYSTVAETIPVYNVSMDNNDGEVYAYSLNLDNGVGRAQNTFAIDTDNNVLYGTIYNKDKFYNYGTDINSSVGLGALLQEENFEDYNYENTFELIDGNVRVKSGILEMDNGAIIETTNEFSSYLGTITSNADNIRIYAYKTKGYNLYCEFTTGSVSAWEVYNGELIKVASEENPKINDWRKFYFGYSRNSTDTNLFCGTDDQVYLAQGTINSEYPIGDEKIRIEAIDNNTLIDDFYVYKGLIGATNNIDNTFQTENLIFNNGDMYLNFYNAGLPVNILSLQDLGWADNFNVAPIKIFSNSDTHQQRLVFFPYAKEFWIYKYAEEESAIPINYYPVENILKPNNYGSPVKSGLLMDPGKLPGTYSVATSFVSENTINSSDYVSFDVNFNKVFSEITNINSGSETPIIQLCLRDNCSEISSGDSNFIFDTDTNQVHIDARLTDSVDANRPFTIVIGFNYNILENFINGSEAGATIEGIQQTAIVNADSTTFDTNQFYLYNFYNSDFPDKKETLIFDVFDQNGLFPQECNFSVNYDKTEIYVDCDQDSLIKIRYRFDSPNNLDLGYPKIKVTKTNEQIVPEDVFENLSGDSFYARIVNKTLDLNFNTGGGSSYKNTIKFLNNNGLLENATIYIKPN